MLAAKLNHEEFRRWVDKELNGYEEGDNVPEYRRLPVHNVGTFSDGYTVRVKNAAVPVMVMEEGPLKRLLTGLTFVQGVKHLEGLAGAEESLLRFAWAAEMIMSYSMDYQPFEDLHMLEGFRCISRSGIEGILDTIRSRLLDFILQLQEVKPGIEEDEKILSEIPPEKVNQVFNFTIHGDHNVLASGMGFSQTVHQTVASHDLTALVHVGESSCPPLQNVKREDTL